MRTAFKRFQAPSVLYFTLSRRSDGPRMRFRTGNLIDFTKRSRFGKKYVKFWKFFPDFTNRFENQPQLDIFSSESGFPQDFGRNSDVFHEKRPRFGKKHADFWKFF